MAETLIRESEGAGPGAGSASAACLRCAEPDPALAPRRVASLGGVDVHRCQRCGTRHAGAGSSRRPLFTCVRCGLPFLADALLPHDRQRCGACRNGDPVNDLPTEEVAAATEAEVLDALATRWHFVGEPSFDAYLDRAVRQIALRAEPPPPAPRVALFEESAFSTLALPAGTILLSTGALSMLEDEAELVFVLGHEMAHAASGDAAVLLSRLGFEAAVRRESESDAKGFAEAAEDLIVLGYGRRRERDADERALATLLALGYEADSALRLLQRMEARVAAGDPRFGATAFAHPPSADRRRRLERSLYGRVAGTAEGKVNREVFRRAVSVERLVPVPAPRWRRPGTDVAGEGRRPYSLAKRLLVAAVVALGFGALALTLLALLR